MTARPASQQIREQAQQHEAAHASGTQPQADQPAPPPSPAQCPECPPGTTTTAPTNSPPLPEGWTIQDGALVKTNGTNDVGSVTVSGAEEDAANAARKKKGNWLTRGLRAAGRGLRGAWGFVAGELMFPSQTVGDAGVSDAPALPDKIRDAFKQGSIRPDRLDSDEVFYRIYGTETSPQGPWLSPTAYSSEATARRDLALRRDWNHGNNASFIVAAVAPAGTLVYRGIAASQGPGYGGGGRQVFIPNTSGLFYGSPRRLGP